MSIPAGIDMSLIDAQLRRTPAERMAVHDRMLAEALRLRQARESTIARLGA